MLPVATPARPEVPKDWMNCTRWVRKAVNRDLVDCFQDLGYKPNAAEQRRIAFMLASGELRTYLRSTLSKLLAVDLQCDSDPNFTPASYAATILIRAIQKIGMFPILYHFCLPRASDLSPKNNMLAGGCGVLISLISQLLEHLEDCPGVNLDFLFRRGEQCQAF